MDRRDFKFPFNLLTVAAVLLTAAASALADSTANPDNDNHAYDWVPRFQLSPAQQQYLNDTYPWCTGRYIEPWRPGKDYQGDNSNAPIDSESDTSELSDKEITTLTGNVILTQGSRQTRSDVAHYDPNLDRAELIDNVVIREPGLLLTGDYGETLFESGWARLSNAEYVLHSGHFRGYSTTLTHSTDKTYQLEQATLTSCPPGDESWTLKGSNMKIDTDKGVATARNAYLSFWGLPLIYSPWFTYPIDGRRHSGFLTPSYTSDSDNGYDLTVPYYWNIAPNYDATLTPRIITERGFLLETEARYLHSSGEGRVGLGGIIGTDQKQESNPYYDEERWLATLQYHHRFTSQWTADIDYSEASDKNYLRDFQSSYGSMEVNQLKQSASTHYVGTGSKSTWSLDFSATQYQNMNETGNNPYNRLPQITLKRKASLADSISLSYLADATWFSRDDDWRFTGQTTPDPNEPDIKISEYDDGFGITSAQGGRLYMQSTMEYGLTPMWGFLKPAVTAYSINYDLNSLNEEDVIVDLQSSYGPSAIDPNAYSTHPNVATLGFSLDSGLFLERPLDLFGNSFTQTLEPRVKYVYIPYVENQQFNPVFDTRAQGFSYGSLWRENRFSGYDRIGDTNHVALGVTTRFVEDSGYERARFGFGQIVYLADRQVYIASDLGKEGIDPDEFDEDFDAVDERIMEELTAGSSPLATQFVYNITRTMSYRGSTSWNTNENRIDNISTGLRWQPESRKVFNLDYRFKDQVDRYVKDADGRNEKDDNDEYIMTRGDLSVVEASVAWPWPLDTNWSALGHWQYDLTNEQNLVRLAGFEYNNCCYTARFFWRMWVEPDNTNIDHPDQKNGVYFQLTLRGLGNVTGSSGRDYLQGIKNYELREN